MCFLRFRTLSVNGTPSLSTTCAVQTGQQGTRKGSPVSSIRMSLPFDVAQRSMTAGFHRYDSFAFSLLITTNSGPEPTEWRSRSRSVMDLTMTARAAGTVISTSLFHLGTKWGGPNTRMRLKPAMYAAAAPMKLLPVPISPTTVVPRWASSERAAPLMASSCAPRGVRSRYGRMPPFSEGR